jgi:hypothetical protein
LLLLLLLLLSTGPLTFGEQIRLFLVREDVLTPALRLSIVRGHNVVIFIVLTLALFSHHLLLAAMFGRRIRSTIQREIKQNRVSGTTTQ